MEEFGVVVGFLFCFFLGIQVVSFGKIKEVKSIMIEYI